MLRLTAERTEPLPENPSASVSPGQSLLHGHSRAQGWTKPQNTTENGGACLHSRTPKRRHHYLLTSTLLYFATFPCLVFAVGELGVDNLLSALAWIAAIALWTLGEVVEWQGRQASRGRAS